MLKKGFTLTELIVVISIIAALLSFLIPTLAVSKERAKTIMCSSNQKQVIMVMLLYVNDNSTFPYAFKPDPINQPPGGFLKGYQYNDKGWWWQNYIEGYLGQLKSPEKVLECPSRKINDAKLKNNLLCGNYGVNQSICKKYNTIESEFKGSSLSFKSKSSPARTVLLLDSGYNVINYWHATANPPGTLNNTIEDRCYIPGARINGQKNIWPGQETDAFEGRHWGRNINAAFADGHLEKKKADSFVVEKTQTGYINLSPLWVPR
jgi:prepilin-type N-terminal cleavage/methylation domain-containing protein/prepilin-type processing-associated H-X9-DG protein